MDINELHKIIQMIENSTVSELSLTQSDCSIKIVRGMGIQAVAASVSSEQVLVENKKISNDDVITEQAENLCKVESPIVGNYYSRPSPDAEPFVHVGDRVKKGETLCIVEAMKFMNEIDAPVNGVIEKIFLKEGQVVEYGETLFLIKPN